MTNPRTGQEHTGMDAVDSVDWNSLKVEVGCEMPDHDSDPGHHAGPAQFYAVTSCECRQVLPVCGPIKMQWRSAWKDDDLIECVVCHSKMAFKDWVRFEPID